MRPALFSVVPLFVFRMSTRRAARVQGQAHHNHNHTHTSLTHSHPLAGRFWKPPLSGFSFVQYLYASGLVVEDSPWPGPLNGTRPSIAAFFPA